MTRACPHCGWPDSDPPFQVLSRHDTPEGPTIWTRCACGSIQVRTVGDAGVTVALRSRPLTECGVARYG